jgi:hypothetical protein
MKVGRWSPMPTTVSSRSRPPRRSRFPLERVLGARDLLGDQLLDGVEVLFVGRRADHHGLAFAARAASAADAVDVVLGVRGNVEVEDVADRGDVEPARRHVRGDEEPQRPVTEPVERARALRLFEVAVDRRGVVAAFLERFRDDIDIGLAVAEDDRVGAASPSASIRARSRARFSEAAFSRREGRNITTDCSMVSEAVACRATSTLAGSTGRCW